MDNESVLFTDSEKLDVLYLVLCKLSVHELYHATLLLNVSKTETIIIVYCLTS